MDVVITLAYLCLALFALLGFFDGFYLHIWKYKLYTYPESKFEHITHTLRALLFPLILILLFKNEGNQLFYIIGLMLVGIDMVILLVDAYSEKDSRAFMGGLPRWEYIIHLVANSLHFASIILFIATTFVINDQGLFLNIKTDVSVAFNRFYLIVDNVLPGAILLAVLHVLVVLPFGQQKWDLFRSRFTCC